MVSPTLWPMSPAPTGELPRPKGAARVSASAPREARDRDKPSPLNRTRESIPPREKRGAPNNYRSSSVRYPGFFQPFIPFITNFITPPGVRISTVSPTLWPMSPAPTGELPRPKGAARVSASAPREARDRDKPSPQNRTRESIPPREKRGAPNNYRSSSVRYPGFF